MEIPHGGIAFFDSGIGGLTVLAECRKRLPDTILYYYGDNARAPYGNLSAATILAYVEEAFSLFCRLQVRAVVLACNTATAVCVEHLRKKYPFPIVGAEPALFPAARAGGEVLVLSTCATEKSERFARLKEKTLACFPEATLSCIPCYTLASEIENNVLRKGYSYVPFLPNRTPTSVVLGCTHYVYIKEQIKAFYRCPVYDGNEGIANRLRFVLASTEKTVCMENFRDERPLVTTAQPPQIFYLGSGKTRNKQVFEQMFGN